MQIITQEENPYKKFKPAKFEQVLEEDAFSKMHNTTYDQLMYDFKHAQPSPMEIFIRQKMDGVSCLMILTLSKTKPDNCVFIHEKLRAHFAANRQQAVLAAKTCQNAWHPYYIESQESLLQRARNFVGQAKSSDSYNVLHGDPRRQQAYGWFHVNIVTSFGFEQPTTDYDVCKYQPLYMPDDVLFQLHRNIAGWNGLKLAFDNVDSMQVRPRAMKAKFLVFRCELFLPAMKAHAVTTAIINSWMHPGQQIENMGNADDGNRVMHARKNFQIYILACVFAENTKIALVHEMNKGFWDTQNKRRVFNCLSKSCLFTRQEFCEPILIKCGQEWAQLSSNQTSQTQNAFFCDMFIATTSAANIHCSQAHGWTIAEHQTEQNKNKKTEIILLCKKYERQFMHSAKECFDTFNKCLRNDNNPLPVITTPQILLHKNNYWYWQTQQKKHKPLFDNFIKSIGMTVDLCHLLCQHWNLEGFVASCFILKDKNGDTISKNVKLKERTVTLCLPVLVCDPAAAANFSLGNWLDEQNIIPSIFPRHSKTIPALHVRCYATAQNPNRQKCKDIEKDIEKQIQENPCLKVRASLAVWTEAGAAHSVSKITCSADQPVWNRKFDTENLMQLKAMPLGLIIRNMDFGHAMPAILGSLQPAISESSQYHNFFRKSAAAILREKARYLYIDATFAFDKCTNLFENDSNEGSIDVDLKIFNPKENKQKKNPSKSASPKIMNTLQEVFETKFCKYIFANIVTTTLVILHMRLMLLNAKKNLQCKENWQNIWFSASKLLKQIICMDIRFAANLDAKSNAQYRPLEWPIFDVLFQELQQCNSIQALNTKLQALCANETSSQSKANKKQKTNPQNLFDTLIAKTIQNMSIANDKIRHEIIATIQKKVQEYAIYIAKCCAEFQEITSNQIPLVDRTASVSFLQTSPADASRIQTLLKTRKDNTFTDIQKRQIAQLPWDKYHNEDMMRQFEIISQTCGQDLTKNTDNFRIIYDLYSNHGNLENQLKSLLTTLQYKYTLAASLHGLLAGKADITDFDPMLYINLHQQASSNPNAHEYLQCIQAIMLAGKKQSIEQNIADAKSFQESMQAAMQEFYSSRCTHPDAAPLDSRQKILDFILSPSPALSASMQAVCNLFANWKFDHHDDKNDHVQRTHKSAKKVQN